jgi:signal transduction histidine kinase
MYKGLSFSILIFLLSVNGVFAERAVDGYLDLSQGIADNQAYRVDGDWKLHFNEFLTYDQLDSADYILFSAPGVWNGLIWRGEEISSDGIGTFWVKVKIPTDWKVLGLKIPTFGSAGKVFVNDQEIFEEGKVGRTKELTVPDYEVRYYHVPLEQGQHEVTLMIHIANFHYAKGGIWNSFFIGDSKNMDHKMHIDHFVDSFLLGVFVIMALYHFILFWMRPKETFTFFFGLICVIIFFRTISTGDYFINQFFPGLSWYPKIRLEFFTFYLAAAQNILFVRSLYPQETKKWMFNLLLWPGVLFAISTLIFSPRFNSFFILPFQIYLISCAGILIYILLQAINNNRDGAKIFIFGLVIAFLTMVNDILYFNYVYRTFIMIHIGVFVYIFSLSFLVAKRYSSAMMKVEKLSDELSDMNRELEDKVEERTSNIKKQNKLIHEQNKELKKIHAEQKNLMAVVAHDLKAPWNKILGLLQVIDISGPLNKSQREIYEKLKEVIKEGRDLINDLSNLNSYEQPDFQPDYTTLDLNSLVIELVNEYRKQAESKNIDLYFVGLDAPFEVVTDKKMLRRVIDNLLSNAIKFSPAERSVFVSLMEERGFFEVSVRDEGNGFSKSDKEKLFRKFQKLSARPTGGETSTGLGLSIVKALTTKLKGKIDLVSEEGQGAKFTVSFPVKP